jgi:hypothetical protein
MTIIDPNAAATKETEETLFAVTHCDSDGDMTTEFHRAPDELAAAFMHTYVKWSSLEELNADRDENECDPFDPEYFDLETLQEELKDNDQLICVTPVPTQG